MTRVLHFSDVHLQAPVTAIPVMELVGKRLLAEANLWLRRGKYFKDATHKLERLATFAREQRIDLALCTGDYTAVGSEAEYAMARQAVASLIDMPLGYLTLPGNHDLYLEDTVLNHRFERHFGDLQPTDLPEYRSDGAYPFVRLVSDHVAVVGVNSARPNPNPFSSAGCVPAAQLEALGRVLDDPRVAQRFTIVMTHYGPLERDGQPDSIHHGLTNADALVRVCARDRVVLAHGHLHWRFAHPPVPGRPWMFCSGSATYQGREGLWIYDVDGTSVRATPGLWTGQGYALEPDKALTLYS